MINPGKGYRLLEPGEKVIERDEFFLPERHGWIASDNWGSRGVQSKCLAYRRRIEIQPQQQSKEKIMGSKIKYVIDENIHNDVNTLKLTAFHPLRQQLIAERHHNRKTGSVDCRFGRHTSSFPAEDFAKMVAKEVEWFENEMRELEERNIKADLVGREIFAAFETK